MLPDAMDLILDSALAHHHTIIVAVEARDGSKAELIAREHARLSLRHLDFALRVPMVEASLISIDRGRVPVNCSK
jgi:DNA-binding GntR family transcriptional regulator